MFLAAAPYFQTRFSTDPWILANSQSAIMSTSTIINLIAMLILTNKQSSANYPLRINSALLLNAAVFALLTLSTTTFLDASPRSYLAFLLLMVGAAAWAAGLMQNGAFSFAASFGRAEYTQAIMAGQGVAGILPPLTQMLSFLAFSGPTGGNPHPSADGEGSEEEGATAAFIYFLTAVVLSAVTLVASVPLVRRHAKIQELRRSLSQSSTPVEGATESEDAGAAARPYVPLTVLLGKLRWLAAAVAMCFVVTMFFPVFTAKILSVNDGEGASRVFLPGAFIPLAFFFWNLGDLAGRVSTMFPALSLRHRPRWLFAFSMMRWGLLPLYLLCNLHGRGAVVESDLFYLAIVQVLFGVTNGWLGSSAMMAAGEWVADGEREAAGGFMSLCLVGGLTVGSVLSFTAAGI